MLLDDSYGGQTGPCRRCQQQITIPNPLPKEIRQEPTTRTIELPWLFGLALITFLMVGVVFSVVALSRWRMVAGPGMVVGGTPIGYTLPETQGEALYQALQAYQADHGTLPPSHTVDAAGKPLHSWRVLLLPYLGRKDLYDKLRLDEPWNSTFNLAQFSAETMPDALDSPNGSGRQDAETSFVAIESDSPFFSPGTGQALAVAAGVERILLVEMLDHRIRWYEPRDVPFDSFVEYYNSAAHPIPALQTDGTVAPLAVGWYSDEQLRTRITRDAAESSNQEIREN
jgi:hypothetical protein